MRRRCGRHCPFAPLTEVPLGLFRGARMRLPAVPAPPAPSREGPKAAQRGREGSGRPVASARKRAGTPTTSVSCSAAWTATPPPGPRPAAGRPCLETASGIPLRQLGLRVQVAAGYTSRVLSGEKFPAWTSQRRSPSRSELTSTPYARSGRTNVTATAIRPRRPRQQPVTEEPDVGTSLAAALRTLHQRAASPPRTQRRRRHRAPPQRRPGAPRSPRRTARQLGRGQCSHPCSGRRAVVLPAAPARGSRLMVTASASDRGNPHQPPKPATKRL